MTAIWGIHKFRTIIDQERINSITMATRNASSSTNVLLAIILVLTFPLWFSLGAALFGIVIGILGAFVGVIAAIFGVMLAIIALPFKILLGWGHGDWGWNWFPHFHHNGFVIVAIILVIALVVRGRK